MIRIGNLDDISKDFANIDERYLKSDPYYFRNKQSDKARYRSLTSKETEILVKNNNTAEDWDKVLVSENFDPALVRNCDFWGMVRIGNLTRSYLEFHKLRLPVGLNKCTITSCDIGDNVVMRNVRYISHYIIGNQCILFNIDEMFTVDSAKFGHGVIKDDELENVRVWVEVANENGGRKILPFKGMLPSDAYIWSKFRDDDTLMQALKSMTNQLVDKRRGYYGHVGEKTVIKNCRIINSVNIGDDCYIKGSNKLKNLTIESSEEEPTQIGEGCELVNGIVGYGNNIFYGVKAVRFVTGRNVQLKYGARLLNSYLGANSNISCCEVLNNLIYPFHEQHHNNSFLIASTVMGQSNIAAGATIGSNHNSRAADGEIIAKRGFWPGLITNFKHNSFFASFTLIAKGSYYAELNVTLPFSLISQAEQPNTINVFPGYWFKHNMYALARNTWKFSYRDKRKIKDQNIETDFLAPDTVEEMFAGMDILQTAINKALNKNYTVDELIARPELDKEPDITLDSILNKGKAKIIKPVQALKLYRMMIFYYGAMELIKAIGETENLSNSISAIKHKFKKAPQTWNNIGGQIIPEESLFKMLKDIKTGKIKTWDQLHQTYNKLWSKYPVERRNHGIDALLRILNKTIHDLDRSFLKEIIIQNKDISLQLLKWTFDSREKDYTNEFRKITFRNEKEMMAVMGTIDDNSFLNAANESMEKLTKQMDNLIQKL